MFHLSMHSVEFQTNAILAKTTRSIAPTLHATWNTFHQLSITFLEPTQRCSKKMVRNLITVSSHAFVFSRSNFVKRHFMIQSSQIFDSITFSIYYESIMIAIQSYAKFLYFIHNKQHVNLIYSRIMVISLSY